MKKLILSVLSLILAATCLAQPITEATATQSAAGTVGQGYYLSPRRAADAVGGVLQAGSNVTLTRTGSNVIISSSGGGGGTDLVFNVKDYGAVGDGTTNDTTAVTNAIAAAVTAGGGIVFFPYGSYQVRTQITIGGSNIALVGAQATINGSADTQYRKFYATGRSKLSFRGLTFDGLYSSATTGIGAAAIELTNCTDVIIEDNIFKNNAKDGIYLLGSCARVQIDGNTFTNNFCDIFSDDDTTNQPTKISVINNRFYSGISGTTKASLSGAMKFSGVTNSNSSAQNVISGNVITTPGEMGIELQTSVNDSSISGNTIYGAKFDISVSGVERVAINGNVSKGFTLYGIEVASSSKDITATGNTIDGRNTSGTVVGTSGYSINSSSTRVSISGGSSGYSSGTEIALDSVTGVTVTGLAIYATQAGLTIKDASSINVIGNSFEAISGADYFIFVDSTDTNVTKVNIQSNRFNGAVDSNGMLLYEPGNAINDLVFANNQLTGASSGGTFVSSSGAGTEARIRLENNYGGGTTNAFTTAAPYIQSVSASSTVGKNNNLVLVDASGGARTITLGSAVSIGMRQFTVVKSDSSTNSVTISGSSGQTINGSSTLSLSSQWAGATMTSDGANWVAVLGAASTGGSGTVTSVTLTGSSAITFTGTTTTGAAIWSLTLSAPLLALSAGTWSGSSAVVNVGTLVTGATGSGFTIALGSSTVTGVAATANGGTGTSSFPQNAILAGPSRGSGAPSTRSLLAVDIPVTFVQDSTDMSVTDNAIPRWNGTTPNLIENSAAILDDSGNLTGIASATLSGILKLGSGPTTINDSAGKILSAALNTVGVAQGGTGATTLAAGSVLIGAGTGAVTTSTGTLFLDSLGSTQGNILYRNGSTWVALAPGTSGQVLTSSGSGANMAWTTIGGSGTVTSIAFTGSSGLTFTGTNTTSAASFAVAGTLAVANGGTGTSSATSGGLVYALSTTTLSTLSPPGSGRMLVSGATTSPPSWSTTATLTGALNLGNPGAASYASSGSLRFPNNNLIGWDNAADSATITFGINGSDIFDFSSGGSVLVNNTTDATASNSGAIKTEGGISAKKSMYIGAGLTVSGSTALKSTNINGTFTATVSATPVVFTGSVSAAALGFDMKNLALDGSAELRAWNDSSIIGSVGSFGSTHSTYGIMTANNPFIYGNGAQMNILADNASGHIRFGTGSSGGTLRMDIGPAGLIQMTAYGAGLASFDGSGNITSTTSFAMVGTSTNNSAAAGGIGEFVSSYVASGSAVSLATATTTNCTSISLTAGDWDVEGNVNFTGSTATVTAGTAGISTTSATLPTDGSEVTSGAMTTALSSVDGITLPRKRISIASTTTVYLVMQKTFSAGTEAGYGGITARRAR